MPRKAARTSTDPAEASASTSKASRGRRTSKGFVSGSPPVAQAVEEPTQLQGSPQGTGLLPLNLLPDLCVDAISKHLCARFTQPAISTCSGSPAAPSAFTDVAAVQLAATMLEAAQLAACLALVGSPACSRLALDLYDAAVDPGCKEAKERALQLNASKRLDWAKELTTTSPNKSKSKAAMARRERLPQLLARPPLNPRRCPVRPRARRLVAALRTPDKQITATRAKSEFKVNDQELYTLPVNICSNPHYRSAAPMRLYKVVDVILLANTKHPELDDTHWADADEEGVEGEREKKEKMAAKRKQAKENLIKRRREEVKGMLEKMGVTETQVRQELNSYWQFNDMSDDEDTGPSEEEVQIKRFTGYLTGSRTVKATDVEQVISSVLARVQRRANLKQELAALGCDLRGDSRLCEEFIRWGSGSAKSIAITMREMKFYFEHTKYEAYRDDYADQAWRHKGYMNSEFREEASDAGKQGGFDEWLARFNSAEEAAARPELPDSLRARVAKEWPEARKAFGKRH